MTESVNSEGQNKKKSNSDEVAQSSLAQKHCAM